MLACTSDTQNFNMRQAIILANDHDILFYLVNIGPSPASITNRILPQNIIFEIGVVE